MDKGAWKLGREWPMDTGEWAARLELFVICPKIYTIAMMWEDIVIYVIVAVNQGTIWALKPEGSLNLDGEWLLANEVETGESQRE